VSNEPLAFCFGVHNHQPIGNFDHVLVEATERAYRPFLELIHARPEVRLTVHCTGSLLEWLRARATPTFDRLGELVARGQVELLTGGFFEPILAVLPDADKIGQIERLSDFLKQHFGVRPRGMWLAERVWEPHLPRVLHEAGVEYVLVDDTHFALAGFEPETLGGYYLTEEQGVRLAVFPISQRLRYLIPFAVVEETVEHLQARHGRVPALTVVDDGEKFGVWPGTYRHVYEEGWLHRFFDRLLALPSVALTTFADVLDRVPASGRVYLPTASYREMGEWALPTGAGRALEAAKDAAAALPESAAVTGLLRGGFWRGFLAKYPEVADMYWTMLRVSRGVHGARRRRPADPRLEEARLALWRGQANDAYWHGVFGGCYLPHLRRAVKSALLEAERLLAEATEVATPSWSRADENGDGREEVVVRTSELAVTTNPTLGGLVTELGFFGRLHDAADVFTRRPELYHDRIRAEAGPRGEGPRTIHDAPAHKEAGLDALLAYDTIRRGSLVEGWFDDDAPLDPVAPWAAARFVTAEASARCAVHADGGAVAVDLAFATGEGAVGVDKRITVRGATVGARYRLRPATARLHGRWAVQWNLALSAGDAPGRYLTLAGSPSLGSTGRATGERGVTLVDEWLGVEARLAWSAGAELAWGPVETVSVSEGGYERIYQGLALLLVWPLAGAEAEVTTELTLASR
jgi:alpha-amylase